MPARLFTLENCLSATAIALLGCGSAAPAPASPRDELIAIDGDAATHSGADEALDRPQSVRTESTADDGEDLDACLDRARWPADVDLTLSPPPRSVEGVADAVRCGLYAPACRELAVDFFGTEPELAVNRACQRTTVAAACAGGDALGCVLDAAAREDSQPALAENLYRKSCSAGIDAACWLASAMHADAIAPFACTSQRCGALGLGLARMAPNQRGPRASRLLDAACASDAALCMERARLAARAADPAADRNYDAACSGARRPRCRTELDRALTNKPGDAVDEQDLAHAVHLAAALCRAGDAALCAQAALLAEEPAVESSVQVDAAALFARGCAGGDPIACTLAGQSGPQSCDRAHAPCADFLSALLESPPKNRFAAFLTPASLTPERIGALARPACRAGQRAACTALIAYDAVDDPDEALAFLRHACSGSRPNPRGCELLGVLLLPSDERAGLAALTRACNVGSGDACTSLATRVIAASVDDMPGEGLTLLERGCQLGSVSACLLLVDHYAGEPARAAQYMTRAQALGYSGC